MSTAVLPVIIAGQIATISVAVCLQVGGLRLGRHRATRQWGEPASMAQHLGTSSRGPSAGDMQDPRWAIKVCNWGLCLQHSPLYISVLREREPCSMAWPPSPPAFYIHIHLQACCEYSSRTWQARHRGLHRVWQCITHLALTPAGQPQYPAAVPAQQHVMSTNPFAVLQPRARRDPRHR